MPPLSMLVARQVQKLIWSGLGTGARRWWPGLRAARLVDPSSAVVAGGAFITGVPAWPPCRNTTPPR